MSIEEDLKNNLDAEFAEYFAIVKSVSEFDQRLLTIKSWGVTLSLAVLGFGFQYRSYGLFLVAAASSLAFWSLESTVKRHQMRYYPRMREIELNRYERLPEHERRFSAPRIDWSWAQASKIFRGELTDSTQVPRPSGANKSYRRAWLLPHVAIPHVITFLLGMSLFLLGCLGYLGGFKLGGVK
jgi:hypothetical protein